MLRCELRWAAGVVDPGAAPAPLHLVFQTAFELAGKRLSPQPLAFAILHAADGLRTRRTTVTRRASVRRAPRLVTAGAIAKRRRIFFAA
jgi:hypothetical protein